MSGAPVRCHLRVLQSGRRRGQWAWSGAGPVRPGRRAGGGVTAWSPPRSSPAWEQGAGMSACRTARGGVARGRAAAGQARTPSGPGARDRHLLGKQYGIFGGVASPPANPDRVSAPSAGACRPCPGRNPWGDAWGARGLPQIRNCSRQGAKLAKLAKKYHRVGKVTRSPAGRMA